MLHSIPEGKCLTTMKTIVNSVIAPMFRVEIL